MAVFTSLTLPSCSPLTLQVHPELDGRTLDIVHSLMCKNKNDLERFSFECRKVIGFALSTYMIGLKNSRHFFIQSEVQFKPIVTHSQAFSRALYQLPVITSSFDWFTVLSVLFVIG